MHRQETNTIGKQVGGEIDGSLDHLTAVLANRSLCEWLRIGKQGDLSLHRTMLACEGVAINILFAHGICSNMVGPFPPLTCQEQYTHGETWVKEPCRYGVG